MFLSYTHAVHLFLDTHARKHRSARLCTHAQVDKTSRLSRMANIEATGSSYMHTILRRSLTFKYITLYLCNGKIFVFHRKQQF